VAHILKFVQTFITRSTLYMVNACPCVRILQFGQPDCHRHRVPDSIRSRSVLISSMSYCRLEAQRVPQMLHAYCFKQASAYERPCQELHINSSQ
jgi:hypothetical protein